MDPTSSVTHVGKLGEKFYFYSQLRQFTTFFFSYQRQMRHDFEHFCVLTNFYEKIKKYIGGLEMVPIRIRQNFADTTLF
jgi:hypothetical protein